MISSLSQITVGDQVVQNSECKVIQLSLKDDQGMNQL